ncbi:MAG: hypothetical protein DME33_14250 [Verrucomicrobia bacterium]|nr:MAG: hypothetical protein DME33_14250 [Verrucomicrobiota bacterium]
MSLYFTSIRQHPLPGTSTEADVMPVAEIAFETDHDPQTITLSVIDGLEAINIIERDSSLLRQFGEIKQLVGLPSGKDPDQPEWSNANIK